MCGLEQWSEACLITFAPFIAGLLLLWFIAFAMRRSDPKRLASTLQTENEESCTTYNMLKVCMSIALQFWKVMLELTNYNPESSLMTCNSKIILCGNFLMTCPSLALSLSLLLLFFPFQKKFYLANEKLFLSVNCVASLLLFLLPEINHISVAVLGLSPPI